MAHPPGQRPHEHYLHAQEVNPLVTAGFSLAEAFDCPFSRQRLAHYVCLSVVLVRKVEISTPLGCIYHHGMSGYSSRTPAYTSSNCLDGDHDSGQVETGNCNMLNHSSERADTCELNEATKK